MLRLVGDKHIIKGPKSSRGPSRRLAALRCLVVFKARRTSSSTHRLSRNCNRDFSALDISQSLRSHVSPGLGARRRTPGPIAERQASFDGPLIIRARHCLPLGPGRVTPACRLLVLLGPARHARRCRLSGANRKCTGPLRDFSVPETDIRFDSRT
jgi:hypothetical protein